MDIHSVVVRPLITEKGMRSVERDNVYTFAVHLKARKDEIKAAVETLFKVHVVGVNTLVRKGKPRRLRFREGVTKDWKEAYVKVRTGERIDAF